MPEVEKGAWDWDVALHHGAAAAEVFGLPWPREISGSVGGDIGGIGTGSSIDFHDQRSYVPGDDPRHINWSAFARTGSYTMKLFREEVQPALDVIVDISASMSCTPEKATRTLSLLTFLAHAAKRSSASVWFYDTAGLPERWSGEEILRGSWPSKDGFNSGPVPNLEAIPLRNRSVRVLVSDLLFDSSPTPILTALGLQAGAAAILAPTIRGERDPDWAGSLDFSDVESDERRTTWCDRGFNVRYREAYKAHFAVWEESSRHSGVRLARVASEGTLISALGEEAVDSRSVSVTR